MRSIRRQLTFSLLALIGAAFALAGGILYRTVTDALVAQFDVGLLARAGALGGLLEFDGEDVEFDYSPEVTPEYEGGSAPEYFALWFADGTEATRSKSLGDASLPRRFGPVGRPESWDLRLADGRAGRALGIEFAVHAPDAPQIPAAELPLMTIVVARSRGELDAALAALATGLLVAAGSAIVLAWWGVTFCVRRGLAPIRSLGQEVEQIDAASLSRRVGGQGVPTELSPFAAKLNELFARLQASFAKERRMTAAMAHELRTPIAELRTASDLARRWPDDDSMVDEVVATASDVALRMSRAVEALMRYCQLEAGQAAPAREAVDLRALLDEAWRPHAAAASERDLHFRNEVPAGQAVQSDAGLLGIVFGNLLGNAASFACGGAIRAWLTREGPAPTVHVGNETDQLLPEDLSHLAEPFWRKDASRTGDQHSGLGLALVKSVTAVLGGRVEFTLAGREFVVAVALDGAPAPPAGEQNGSFARRRPLT